MDSLMNFLLDSSDCGLDFFDFDSLCLAFGHVSESIKKLLSSPSFLRRERGMKMSEIR